jgi:hypothetical protein
MEANFLTAIVLAEQIFRLEIPHVNIFPLLTVNIFIGVMNQEPQEEK